MRCSRNWTWTRLAVRDGLRVQGDPPRRAATKEGQVSDLVELARRYVALSDQLEAVRGEIARAVLNGAGRKENPSPPARLVFQPDAWYPRRV